MNSLRTFFLLFRLTIRSMSFLLWFFPVFLSISLWLAFKLNRIHGEYSDFDVSIGPAWGFLMPILIGMMFFTELSVGGAKSGPHIAIPFAEFLIVRPIFRREAYLPRVVLYLVFAVAAPLVNLGLASSQPELEFSLYRSATQSTEAADHLALYQAAFPNSRIVQKEKKSHGTLVIPAGRILVALWQLLIAALLASVMQAVIVLNLPKALMLTFPGFLLVLVSWPTVLWDKAHLVERAFFFFVGHLPIFIVATVAAVAIIQLFAWKRVQEFEVI